MRDILQHNATVSELPEATGAAVELTPQQQGVLSALFRGASVTAAARELGVCRTTVHRWMRYDPVFISSYNSIRQEIASAVKHEIVAMARQATSAIRECLSAPGVPAATRLRAAEFVLQSALQAPAGPTDPADAELAILKKRVTKSTPLM